MTISMYSKKILKHIKKLCNSMPSSQEHVELVEYEEPSGLQWLVDMMLPWSVNTELYSLA